MRRVWRGSGRNSTFSQQRNLLWCVYRVRRGELFGHVVSFKLQFFDIEYSIALHPLSVACHPM